MKRALLVTVLGALLASCATEDAPTTDPCGPGELSIGAGDCLKLQDADAGFATVVDDAGADAGEGGAR